MSSFRFWRRIPIISGLLHLNLSKGGVSVSAGKPGASFTVGRRGPRATVGLPGTGLSCSETFDAQSEEETKPRSRWPSFWVVAIVVGLGVYALYYLLKRQMGG